MNCDVGEATEGLEIEVEPFYRAHSTTLPLLHLRHLASRLWCGVSSVFIELLVPFSLQNQ